MHKEYGVQMVFLYYYSVEITCILKENDWEISVPALSHMTITIGHLIRA
jgi:hypothetical protein